MELHRLICAAGVLILACATAGAAQVGATPAPDVTAALQTCRELTIFDHVTAHLDNGTLVLSGKVTSGTKRSEVERRVSGEARASGVAALRNEIAILPPSAQDDDLRYRVSRAIYGHPAFWSYAAMPRPPIHIIVENGTVTLAGTVSTPIERAMAASLATARAQRPVDNQLAVGR